MRRLLGTALAAILLAVLSTALLVGGAFGWRASDPGPLAALDELVRVHASLVRDELLANAGGAVGGEALTADAGRMDHAVQLVREGIRRDRLDEQDIDTLAHALGNEQTLIGRLGSRQVSVRDALAGYLALKARLSIWSGPSTPSALVAALDRPMLALGVAALSSPYGSGTFKPDDAIWASISALASLALPDLAEAALMHQFVSSATALARLLTESNAPVQQIAAEPVDAAVVAVRAQLDRHATQMRQRERDSGLTLCVASLVLAAVAMRILAGLRASLLALEDGARRERIAAQVSALLFGCEPERIGESMASALAIIGLGAGLDGVTVVTSDPDGLHRWARDPLQPRPPAPLLFQAVEEAAGGRAGRITRMAALSSVAGPAARLLSGCGVRVWAGAGLRCREQPVGLVSFEVTRRRTGRLLPGMDLLGSLVEIIETALERRQIATDRETVRVRSLHAQRLQAAGELASGLAHNFNNIVGAVVGHAEMAAHCVDRGTSPLPHIDEIRRAAERAGELIETMLNLNRRNLPCQEVVVSSLVAETVSLLQASLPPEILLSVEDAGGDTTVFGRTAELQQVVLNLVRNAAQALPEGGQVTIRLTRAAVAAPRYLAAGLLQPGSYVTVSVSDTGRGMDQATLARAFEPFFSMRPAGTGLGLATAADIVRDLGGIINARSAVGVGSDFDVWLPRADSHRPSNHVSARRGRGEVVLIVETDQQRLLRAEDTLAALGYEPAGALSLQAALDAIGKAPNLHDAALVGLQSEDTEDAIKVCASLHALRPGLPVVVVGNEDRLATQLRVQGMETVAVIGAGQGAWALASSLAQLLDNGLSRDEAQTC